MDRRAFVAGAAAMGAVGVWARPALASPSTIAWREDRTAYPQGVASGDPDDHSVILWTRRPFADGERRELSVEVAHDAEFRHVVASARVPVLAAADWTCRVLVGGLSPATLYWYRFTDDGGAGSRVGRTITAPRDGDARPVRFAFVSCQSVNEGAQNAYRRMIWEDEKAAADQKLGFVLHLGDFIYEVVEYPEELATRYSRTVYDLGKVPDARKVQNFHVPTNLAGYRHVYRAHIDDPDIQDARAHFPFVCIGDNHEFSWQGWQSFITYPGTEIEPAQPLRVAANQAWWEYIPARVKKVSGPGMESFDPPQVSVAPIDAVDDHGFGDEPNNRAAVGSMTAYRALRYGRHVELILTDFHSYKMQDPTGRKEGETLDAGNLPFLVPQSWMEILDGGRDYDGGKPPAMIQEGEKPTPNFRKTEPAYTVLGYEQKAWLKARLAGSRATWKIWGATNGTLDMRTDPVNLPTGAPRQWPGNEFGVFGGGDFSAAYAERAEIYDLVRDRKVTGFVTVSGDRHSFWAGYAAKALPPERFEPVGVTFITGSISAPGLAEALEFGMKTNPLKPLFSVERPGKGHEATINLAIKHGVRSALEYAASGDLAKAHAASNPDVAPHLEFVDMSGHGYTVVTAGPKAIETEFVCIERPIKRATTPDGGPLRYRVTHRAAMWDAGGRPRLEQRVVEGDAGLAI